MEQQENKKRILIGVVIIVVGALLLMRNFGVYDDYISKYIFHWEMILISIGLISIVSHEGRGPGYLMLLLGGIFYTRNVLDLTFFEGINFWQLFLAFMFIFAGIFVIFKRKSTYECKNPHRSTTDMDTMDEVAVFGGGDRTIVSDSFKGGKLLAVFGGSNFNLMRSKLAPGKNYIDVLVVFGGFKLVVPEEWNVKINAISIFGGLTDKHRVSRPKPTENESELIIKGFVIFGGGELKSY
ncbi:MAG: hypothetical protein JXA77_07900 [Bacteroidales bacterium]|nr:hypothetical protein [Bacteroidales bacterium]MBN2819511.1 hypothetical protein [Bacteroidales bacterium]